MKYNLLLIDSLFEVGLNSPVDILRLLDLLLKLACCFSLVTRSSDSRLSSLPCNSSIVLLATSNSMESFASCSASSKGLRLPLEAIWTIRRSLKEENQSHFGNSIECCEIFVYQARKRSRKIRNRIGEILQKGKDKYGCR